MRPRFTCVRIDRGPLVHRAYHLPEALDGIFLVTCFESQVRAQPSQFAGATRGACFTVSCCEEVDQPVTCLACLSHKEA